MEAGLIVQYALVAIIVAWCAWVAIGKLLPRQVRALRGRIAMGLLRDGRPAAMQAFGRRIAPAANVDAGCGSCNDCGPTEKR